MIIDSHAHYNNNAYKKPFPYLSYDKDGYALKEGDREQLFQELLEANIPYSIEPGVSLQSCEEVLQLCGEYPGRIFLPLVFIPPDPFLRSGLTGKSWTVLPERPVWLPSVKSVWIITTSVRSSTG